MKKIIFPVILLLSLLLSACQPQPASPAEVATFCADLTVFMTSVEKFVMWTRIPRRGIQSRL